MDKVRVNILIDRGLRQKCKERGINISAFTEIKLQEYLAIIEGKASNPPYSINGPEGIRTPVTGSEGQ